MIGPRSLLAFGLVGLGLLATVLGACSRDQKLLCSRDTIYLDARTVGTLNIPDDLSIPDASESLRVPDIGIPDADETGDGCLEHSPAYRDGE